MLGRRSKMLQNSQQTGRKELSITPCPLELSRPVVLLRIFLAAILFTGLALTGLRVLGAFGGRRLVIASITPLLDDIADARIQAIWYHCPHRVILTDLPSTGRYRIEAYRPTPNEWSRHTMRHTDAATASHLWQPVVEGIIQPCPVVTLGSTTVIYINPDGWFFDHCFFDYWGRYKAPPLLFTRYSFRAARESVTIALTGKEIRILDRPWSLGRFAVEKLQFAIESTF